MFADFGEVYDFDVHPDAVRVAFAFWEDDARHLAVKELRAVTR